MIAGLGMSEWVPAPLPEPKPKRAKREHYVAALMGSNTLASLISKDQVVKSNIVATRSNSRQLHNNNPFFRKWVRHLGTQVVGPKGIQLMSLAPGDGHKAVEAAWKRWGARGVCTTCGGYSFAGLTRMALRTTLVDGEVFIRLVRRYKHNGWRFALQFFDPDMLDTKLDGKAENGNQIVMGVEKDEWGRPTAYYFSDPKDISTAYARGRKIRIPAEDIIHWMLPERPVQTRGMAPGAASMFLLDLLGDYWLNEVASAKHEAERPGFITSDAPDIESPGEDDDQEDAIASPSRVEIPGTLKYWRVPAGDKIEVPDIQHPNANLPDFSKAILKGAGVGMGISYASVSGDLTETSWASIRQGVQEDRDYFQELQEELIEVLCERIFPVWWDYAWISGKLPLDTRVGVEKLQAHRWVPRGWAWVDPKSETAANEKELTAGTTSRTRIAAARGEDISEIFDELEWETKELAKKKIQLLQSKPDPQEPGEKESPDGDA